MKFSTHAEKWLDEMLGSGLIEFDSDDSGEIFYTMLMGRFRPTGPRCLPPVTRFRLKT